LIGQRFDVKGDENPCKKPCQNVQNQKENTIEQISNTITPSFSIRNKYPNIFQERDIPINARMDILTKEPKEMKNAKLISDAKSLQDMVQVGHLFPLLQI